MGWHSPVTLANAEWRVGRSVGRTVYAVLSDESTMPDVLIGVMDTATLARRLVTEHNAARIGTHPSWAALMACLDLAYPADVFTAGRDPGAQIVHLLRQIDVLRTVAHTAPG